MSSRLTEHAFDRAWLREQRARIDAAKAKVNAARAAVRRDLDQLEAIDRAIAALDRLDALTAPWGSLRRGPPRVDGSPGR